MSMYGVCKVLGALTSSIEKNKHHNSKNRIDKNVGT